MSDDVDAEGAFDPFWSVVRRRHPDLDIVLLPPEPPAPAESGLAPRAPETFAQEHVASTDRLWAELVGHGMPYSTATWIPGPTGDAVRRSLTLTLGDAEETVALEHLRDAVEWLRAHGWRVFLPPTGMPRIMADRDGDLGDEQLLVGYAPAPKNLFLRFISTGVPVGAQAASALIGAAA